MAANKTETRLTELRIKDAASEAVLRDIESRGLLNDGDIIFTPDGEDITNYDSLLDEINSKLPLSGGELTGGISLPMGESTFDTTSGIKIGNAFVGAATGGLGLKGQSFIDFRTAGSTRLRLTSSSLYPMASAGIDLGTASSSFNNIHGKAIYQNGEPVALQSEIPTDYLSIPTEYNGGGTINLVGRTTDSTVIYPYIRIHNGDLIAEPYGDGKGDIYAQKIYQWVGDAATGSYKEVLTVDTLPETEGLIDKTVSDLENYYLKSETYTQTEINNKIPTKTSQLTNDGNGVAAYANVNQLALKKTVYTATCSDDLTPVSYSISVSVTSNLPYTSFDSIPNGTTIDITLEKAYTGSSPNDVMMLSVNGMSALRVLVNEGKSDGYYTPYTLGGWKAGDVLTFVKGRSWMLTMISGRVMAGTVPKATAADRATRDGSGNPISTTYATVTSVNAISSSYLRGASVADDTLTLTKQDGSTVKFQGGSKKGIWRKWS